MKIACHDIADPLTIWTRYARRYAKTLRDYDLAETGDPNLLTTAEAWRTRKIGSRITRSECDQLELRALAAPWRAIPAAADLADADPADYDGLFAQATELYWHFTWPERTRGVRVAKVHKVLHLKRPALYPLLDSRVRWLYRDCASQWIKPLEYLGDLNPDDSPPYWAAIRRDLIACGAELERYRKLLAAEPDHPVRILPDNRLLDILGWAIAKQQQHR